MISIIGTMFGTSGYDMHTRELANALNKLTDISLNVNMIPDWTRHVNDVELEMIKKVPDDDINLIITTPIYWKLYTNAKRNWAYLVWEGDKIPKSWIEECLNPDIEYIFVPSEHTKEAVLKTLKEFNSAIQVFLPSKIKVIPHGVDLEKFYPKPRIRVDNENVVPFTFLANKGLRNMQDRGGIQYLIKAYLEEFTKEDNVELLLKINPAYGIPNLLEMFPDTKKEDAPKIRVITDNVPYNELVNIYNQADVFVSPTRAEAFNIPCLEALATGLPVITTDFGGQTDYCSMETGWIIGGELEEVKHELQYEGIKWLIPDLQQLKKALRQAYSEKKDFLDTYSNAALETAKQYTWENTAKKILDWTKRRIWYKMQNEIFQYVHRGWRI